MGEFSIRAGCDSGDVQSDSSRGLKVIPVRDI